MAEPPPQWVREELRDIFGFDVIDVIGRYAAWAFSVAPDTVRITSWWRGVRENHAVGGHPTSQHLMGTAADFGTELHPAIKERMRRLGWIVIDKPDHVHVQVFRAGFLDRIGVGQRFRDWLANWLGTDTGSRG